MNGSYEPPGVFSRRLIGDRSIPRLFMIGCVIPQNGFIGHRGARRCGAVAEGMGRAHLIQTPCGSVAVRRKLPSGANQRARETRNWDNGFGRSLVVSRQLNSVGISGASVRVPVNGAADLSVQRTVGSAAVKHQLQRALLGLADPHHRRAENSARASVRLGKLYEVQNIGAGRTTCWSGYWIVANRRALSSLPADLVTSVNQNLDAAAIKTRRFAGDDRSLQAELAGQGHDINKPDPVQFRAALVKASFYTQWAEDLRRQAWALAGAV